MTSSLVGAKTMHRGEAAAALISTKGFFCTSCAHTGRRKAQVLPDPVWAQHIKSSPASAAGMAWRWIGVGVEYFISVRFRRMEACSESWSKANFVNGNSFVEEELLVVDVEAEPFLTSTLISLYLSKWMPWAPCVPKRSISRLCESKVLLSGSARFWAASRWHCRKYRSSSAAFFSIETSCMARLFRFLSCFVCGEVCACVLSSLLIENWVVRAVVTVFVAIVCVLPFLLVAVFFSRRCWLLLLLLLLSLLLLFLLLLLLWLFLLPLSLSLPLSFMVSFMIAIRLILKWVWMSISILWELILMSLLVGMYAVSTLLGLQKPNASILASLEHVGFQERGDVSVGLRTYHRER